MHFAQVELEILKVLFDQLAASLDGVDGPDDVIFQRLYPPAYPDDDDAASEFRALTEDSLRAERQQRLDACRADLDRGVDVELGDPDVARRWIQVLNDLRLAVGTRLGITEEDDHDIDPLDAADEPRVIYYFLTAVQDGVVQALMR